jgi:hypothetical protein
MMSPHAGTEERLSLCASLSDSIGSGRGPKQESQWLCADATVPMPMPMVHPRHEVCARESHSLTVRLSVVTHIYAGHGGDGMSTRAGETVSQENSHQPSVSRPLGN